MPQLGLGLGAQINESNSFDPDALRYFATAGVTDATGRSQINTFVRGIKSLGLYNNMVAWPLRSTQNAGTGVTAYSLGGLGVYDATLIGAGGLPTWGTTGITFDGTDDYIDTAFTTGLSAYSIFSATQVTVSGARRYEYLKDATGTRQFGSYQETTGSAVFYQINSSGTIVTNADAFTSNWKMQCFRGGNGINKFRRNNGSDTNGTTGTITPATVKLRIGATQAATPTNYFLGIMAGLIVFNTALTDSQTSAVYALYQTSLGAGLGLPDADASAYIARAGVTDTTGQQQINDFVVGVKNLGLYNNMVAWPLRSTQNATTGTTAYSLGGLGTFDGQLINGPTWGTGGITFDGVDDYIDTTLGTVQPEITAISVTTPSATTTALELTKSGRTTNREFEIAQVSSFSRFNTTGADGFLSLTGPAITTSVCKFVCARMSEGFRRIRKDNGSDISVAGSTRATVAVNVRIGAYSSVTLEPFPGVIHTSIVFNKALTDSETSSMYTLYSTTLGSGLGLP
jgi:hypothetical protein